MLWNHLNIPWEQVQQQHDASALSKSQLRRLAAQRRPGSPRIATAPMTGTDAGASPLQRMVQEGS